MNLKQATLIALVGELIAFGIHILQFILAYETYSLMGIKQLMISLSSLLFNHFPMIIFLTVLYLKQQANQNHG